MLLANIGKDAGNFSLPLTAQPAITQLVQSQPLQSQLIASEPLSTETVDSLIAEPTPADDFVHETATEPSKVTPTITPAEINVVTVSDFVSAAPVSMPLLSLFEISVSVNDDNLNQVRFASETYAALNSTSVTPLALAGAHDLVDSLFSDEVTTLNVNADLNNSVEDEFLAAWE